MFLLIGHESDLCCGRVEEALRGLGQAVLLTPEPLAGENTFTWTLETRGSDSRLHLADGRVIPATALRGVLVRARGGPVDSAAWSPEDLAYVRAETQAALFAWLWGLPCTVVNRLPADLWFRPQRPFVE